MNYVGQLAGTVLGTMKDIYQGLNPATLSGGIDVLVVKQVDGSFRCSPFHVRFGKLGVLRSREKVVDIEINGEPVDLHMKLGDSGEAFFIQELESDDEHVPPCLCTSPIPCGDLSGLPSDSQLSTASEPEAISDGVPSTGRKKRLRRRKPRRKEGTVAANSSSEELETGTETPSAASSQKGSPYRKPETSIPTLMASGAPSSASRRVGSHPLRVTQSWSCGPLSPAPHELNPTYSGPGGGCRRKETTPRSCRDAGLPLPSKSWSWATLEGPVATREPEGGSRREGSLKRSQHLGPSDIYLDDLPSLDSENAALYFPQSDCGLGPRRWSEPNSQKPLGDPNPEQEPEPTLDMVDMIELSLCGGLAESRDISLEKFNQHIVSYQDLVQNPGLLEHPNLVVKINENPDSPFCLSRHYNWAVAAPMILSLQAFQRNLPKSTVDKLEKEKMPRKGGRWWFSWRRRDFPARESSAQTEKTTAWEQQGEKTDVLSSEDDAPESPVILDAPSLPPSTPAYKKSLRLSSNQIRRLNLQEGANDVVFSVTTQYQGTCRCRATIYLWKWDDKVVISDIDGTITKSDALGHILPQLGKDWTHQGITSLYHKIHLNGFKFLYCSARAIGMADLTKAYLQWVSERGCGLPKGPILLSPSSLFSALHREVIEKKPEVFKIACLSDIRQLFLPNEQPFYAAFGNRPNDVTAYRQVGLPESRIFTVNPRGELIQELMKNHKSTYERLGEVVELLFPPVARGPSADLASPEYSNFCYWREPLVTVDLDALA
ncbi:phosphatidate phosphatase LPIN3 isoform X5 [Leptonychotes weddellii]|uniref:phosphatidate phosphatase n=1 Tax=Leptonychotes weddellii TaxID=9713 RepID=A0A7F8RUV1_LEPWE|nr:phosphatidate phosphatase LPIN3 isoform X5 [Leptonychotes weddellii]